MPRSRLPRAVLEVCSALLALLVQIQSPLGHNDRQRLEMLRLVLLFLFLLTSIVNPPPNEYMPIMQRLDLTFYGYDYRGRDLFGAFENQRFLFWLNTGELPETLLDITAGISRDLARFNRRRRRRQRIRGCKLGDVNKVLLTIVWLRKYPCVDTLALIFDVSPSTVSSIIHSVVPILWQYFKNQVDWPSIQEWNSLRGTWASFPDAVGCIDGTPHEIYRP